MNDIVSIRKMRPREPEPGCAGRAEVSGVGTGPADDDFLRGGNSLSLAAGEPSEVDVKIGFYRSPTCSSAIAEHEKVPGWLAECGGHAEINILLASSIGCED